ncbi:hypothetical protein HanHA300_Chr14g0542041 [Helianthus annuus]|nr:hypothetical protein HanHA300_Chr14g0542041 [Helianthus annuus]KAJ0470692.1 hypothetical protein HanIR_Chr14g0721561 [Helianthus annuus]
MVPNGTLTNQSGRKIFWKLRNMLWPNRWNTLADISVNGIHPSSYYVFPIHRKFETLRDF